MGAHRHIEPGSASALPLNLLAQAIPMLTRAELADLTERLIDRLDLIDGDPADEDGEEHDEREYDYRDFDPVDDDLR